MHVFVKDALCVLLVCCRRSGQYLDAPLQCSVNYEPGKQISTDITVSLLTPNVTFLIPQQSRSFYVRL